jgi:hypothetical protein
LSLPLKNRKSCGSMPMEDGMLPHVCYKIKSKYLLSEDVCVFDCCARRKTRARLAGIELMMADESC